MKEQLAKHLQGGEAFQPLEHFLEKVSFDTIGVRPNGLPYSVYELFYHIVFTQKDILDFIVSGSYQTPNWPEAYWPKKLAPTGEKEWRELVSKYFEHRQQLITFLMDDKNDLSDPVKNDEKQTLLREILLVLEHTAYHTGQLVVIMRLLGDR